MSEAASSSSSSAVEITEEEKRAERLIQLKKKLAWEIASELCPVQDLGNGTGDGEERERRMVNELTTLMGRVKEARLEYKKAEEVFSTNLPAVSQQLFTCKHCGNKNTNNTFLDPRNGDTVCMGLNGASDCGEILQDHQINRGAAKRNFEDVEDKNHHGPPSDALYPDSVNMRTTFITSAQGKPGKDSRATKLAQISKIAEMDLSNIGHEGRASTRTGYKTQQKLEAFNFMTDMSIKLGIHEAVIEAAKEEFAKFREVKERVEKFKGVLCACILLAFEELAHEYDSKVSYDSVRSRDGLTNTTKSYVVKRKEEDVACVTVGSKKAGDWSLEEVKKWMTTVASKDPTSKELGGKLSKDIATQAVQYLTSEMDQESARLKSKERMTNQSSGVSAKIAAIPDLPFFGTTTSAKRSDNKSLNGVKQNGASKTLTAGQRFIRLKGRIPDILKKNGKTIGDKEMAICTRVFDAAIERRLKFDVSAGELERLAKAEAQRLETEEKMNLKGTELKEFLATYNKKVADEEDIDDKSSVALKKAEAEAEVAASAEEEQDEELDPLAELLGDDMPVSTSSGFDVAAPVAKADAKPKTQKKRERDSSGGSVKKKIKKEEQGEAPIVVPQITIVKDRSK